MTENQEQRSQSSHMIVNSEIEPLLQPQRAVITLNLVELHKKFDEFFQANETAITAMYKGKIKGQKVKGGKVKNAQKILESQLGVNSMYAEVLHQLIHTAIPDVFFIEGCKLFNSDAENEGVAKLVTLFYYTPDLELLEDIKYVCESPVQQAEEDAWVDRCIELKQAHKTTEPYNKEDLNIENLEVLIDLIVTDDKYTLRRTWIELDHLPAKLRKCIKQHKKGDLFETKYQAQGLAAVDKDKDKDQVVELGAHIKIYDVRKLVYPEIGDALAKLEKFDNLEQFRTQFQVDYDEYLEQAKQGIVYNYIVNEIVEKSKLPYLPDVMIRRNAQAWQAMHLARCQDNEQQAIMVLGAKTAEEMGGYFRTYAIQKLLADSAARKYAKIHNLPFTENILIDHMMNEIEWIDKKEEKNA